MANILCNYSVIIFQKQESEEKTHFLSVYIQDRNFISTPKHENVFIKILSYYFSNVLY